MGGWLEASSSYCAYRFAYRLSRGLVRTGLDWTEHVLLLLEGGGFAFWLLEGPSDTKLLPVMGMFDRAVKGAADISHPHLASCELSCVRTSLKALVGRSRGS